MCGSEQGWVVGGLIVAAAMLISAFAGRADTAGPQHHQPQHRPPAHTQSHDGTLLVSLDPLALSMRSGDLTVEVKL